MTFCMAWYLVPHGPTSRLGIGDCWSNVLVDQAAWRPAAKVGYHGEKFSSLVLKLKKSFASTLKL